ncbi:MAG: hypothetical protein IK099_01725 [Clostridia bacterium]|nr:hypothetical protein [Clostridia bacterium]
MFRTSTSRVEHWCDKTMSVMRERQLEACQDRLYRYPAQGLFGKLCADEIRDLFHLSFYAREIKTCVPGQAELQSLVLKRAEMEACYLSPREDDLIKRILMGGGEAFLNDWDEISAAEALISRLWCTLQILDEDAARVCLAPELTAPITKAMLSEEYAETRKRLFSFDATLHSLLYLSGFLHASVPLTHFYQAMSKNDDEVTPVLISRYLRAAFDYTQTPEGEILLLHPGLADPEHLLSTLSKMPPAEVAITREMMLGGLNGLLPEEVASCETMRGALTGAIRPEYDEEEALEDLRMMAKQGASLGEMREVMESMLCVLPTPRMVQALGQLHLQTVRWIGMPPAVLN